LQKKTAISTFGSNSNLFRNPGLLVFTDVVVITLIASIIRRMIRESN